MTPPCRFSVVIPVGRENGEAAMRAALEDSGYGRETELIFVHGSGTAGEKRNRGVAESTGVYLVFLDDDVFLPKGYLQTLGNVLEASGADVCGGPNVSPPGNRWQQAVERAFSTPLGFGPGAKRFKRIPLPVAGDEDCLTGCNLCIRHDAFLKAGGFDPRLVTGEEVDLIHRLRAAGCRMRYDPAITLYHQRRATPRALWRQIFAYGRGRAVLIRKNGARPRELAYLLPSLLAVFTCASPFLPPLAAGAGLGVYFLSVAACGLVLGGPSAGGRARLAAALLIMHYAYGIGMLTGFIQKGGANG